MSGATAVSVAPPAQLPATRRKRTPFLIAGLSLAAVLVSAIWYLLHLGRESTDDAQVEGRVMSVSARVAGQVLRVHVEDNQLVKAGDVLLELDPADHAAKADAARADVAAARATADGARSALAMTEKTAPANLVQAQGGLTAAASSLTSAQAAIEQAKADLVAAESRESLAELNLKRARALVEANALPAADLDLKQTEFEAAAAQYQRERARVAAAQAGRAGSGGGLVLARGRLTAAQTAAEQVASARAALALAEARTLQAEAALKLAELNLSYTTVRAPRRGVVSRRSVEEGQTVSPERPLLAINVDAYGSLVAEQRTLLEHGPGARLFDPQGAALAVLNQRIGAQALLRAFNNTFLLLAFAFLAASWVIVLMRRPQRGGAVDVNAH